MSTITTTTTVSDVTGEPIGDGNVYRLTVIQPDGSTRALDLSLADWQLLGLDGKGEALSRSRSTSRKASTGGRRGRPKGSKIVDGKLVVPGEAA